MIKLNTFVLRDCMDYLPQFTANKSQLTLFNMGMERK